MTKAAHRTSTLDVTAETLKLPPLTPVQKLASQVREAYAAMDECERIRMEADAQHKSGTNDPRICSIGVLGVRAQTLMDEAWARESFIEEQIAHADPVDAVDAFIMLNIYRSKVDASERWPETAFEAKTESEREALLRKFDAETKDLQRLLNAILRGLSRGLGITPEELGIGSYASDSDFGDFATAFENLKRDAKKLLG